MSEINHPVIRSIKTVKTNPFHNYDLHYVCEIGSTGLGNPIPFTAEKEFSICEHTQSSVNWSLCWIPAPDKKQTNTKNNPHQVDDRCQAKGSKELITKQTTSSSDKHWLSEGEAAGN